MARPLFDSPYLFGIHEPGGEENMVGAGRPGWIVFTEGIGHDPNNRSGRDYRAYSSQGLGVLTRLNNGYHPEGTIPTSDRYAEFAQRCANFVAASQGCKLWIIGNEMNYDIERPRYSAQPPRRMQQPLPPGAHGELPGDAASEPDGFFARWWNSFLHTISGGMGDAELGRPTPPARPPTIAPPQAQPIPHPPDDPFFRSDPGRFSALHPTPAADAAPGGGPAAIPSDVEVITPRRYADCYRLCRDAILSVPGHASDQVLIGSVAPWNNQTTYPGNERGDWVAYLRDILQLLGPDGCDGITIHTYTHAADKNLIYSEAKMGAPFTDRHYEFRTYRDFMDGIPASMRHLPVYLTETDQDVAWLNQNIGWVQAAYGEIDFWNRQPGNQQIRNMILYRWPKIDRWYIEGKEGVIDDFRQSLQNDFTWRVTYPPVADYVPGDLLATRDIVNLRRTPGYRNQPATDVIGALPEQQRLRVRDSAPQRVDDLVWWEVQEEGGGRQGWIAQFSPAALPLVRLLERAAPDKPDGALEVGALAKTLDTVRLRRTPGYVDKPAEDTLAFVAPDIQVAIVSGPAATDGLTWWEVRGVDAESRPFRGWMAESAPNSVRLLTKTGDLAPGQTPDKRGKFSVGDQAVTTNIVRLRRTPGYAGKGPDDIIADLPLGATGVVLGGPRSADQLIWWLLRMALPGGNMSDGWAAESDPNGMELLAEAAAAPDEGATFAPGDAAITLDFVRLRRTPGYAGKEPGDVIADVPPSTAVTVAGTSRRMDDLTWWPVDAPVDGRVQRGWMAETAPGGVALLSPAVAPPQTGVFAPGELIQALTSVRVRNSPGIASKPDDDVLGEFAPQATLNVIDGPREVDGLTWYRVGGISPTAADVLGWVAQAAANGVKLLGRAPKLPGTDIPNQATGAALAMPFRGDFGIAQLWGERPEVYKQFSYDGVPLKGHNGIDFLTPVGTELQAVDGGVVKEAVFNDPSGFGHYVLLRHSWGEALYAHLDSIAVTNGQTLQRGELIGRSGNTGNSEGPHLHFAIRINPYARTDGWGGYSDPLPYLPRASVRLPDYVLPPAQRRPIPQGLAAPVSFAPMPATFAPGMAPDAAGVRRP